MACDCSVYNDVCVYINPCIEGTSLNIIAEESGVYSLYLEFNNTTRVFGLSASVSTPLTIFTNLLNENYIHNLRVISPSFVEKCYRLHTSIAYNESGATPPIVGNNNWGWHKLTGLSGMVISSDYFKGEISPIIWLNESDVDWVSQGIVHNPTARTLDFSAVGGFEGSISFQYRNIII